MKRPSTLTLLLLISAAIPLGFLPVWFVLGTISLYLALAFFILPILVFLPLFTFASTERWLRRTRQLFEKPAPTDCIICGESLPSSSLRQAKRVQGPHYETVHPEVWKWSEKWSRRVLPVVLPLLFVIATIATYGLIVRNYFLFIVGIALVGGSILGINWLQKSKLKSFRTQWSNHREQSSSPARSDSQNRQE